MSQTMALIMMLVLLGAMVGIVVGALVAGRGYRKRIEAAYEQGFREAEEEKAHVTTELGHQLERMREGLEQSLSAYDNAAALVEEKLQLPGQKLRKLDAPAKAHTPESKSRAESPKQASEVTESDESYENDGTENNSDDVHDLEPTKESEHSLDGAAEQELPTSTNGSENSRRSVSEPGQISGT